MNARRVNRLFGTLLFAAGLGCGDETGPAVTPRIIEIVSGDGQGALPGEAAPQPLRVRVTGSDGQPLAGSIVRWTVTEGQATVTPTQGPTDAQGEAQTSVTLQGAGSGVAVQATVQGLEPVTFTVGALDPCSITSARPLSLDVAITGTLRTVDCDLGDGSFRDLYALTLGAQQAVTARVSAASFDPEFVLFARERNGQYFDRGIHFDTVDARRSAVSTWILPAGEYIVTPSSWDPGMTGGYDLLLSPASGDADECRAIWILRRATTAQRLATTDCSDTPGPFYRDVFLVVLWQGERVTLTQSSTEFAPRLRLLRRSGGLISEADGTATGTALIGFTSDETSVYIVHATSVIAGRSGTYTLGVIDPGTAAAPSRNTVAASARILRVVP